MKFTDEDLNALLDGEMSPEKAEMLRSEFQTDPILTARYTELAMADMQFRDLVDSLDEQPMSEEIYRMLATDAKPPSSSDISIAKVPHALFQSRRISILAFASLSIITFGLVSAFLLSERPQVDVSAQQHFTLSQSYYDSDHPLADALSTVSSDTSQNLDGFDNAIVMPILSFKSTAGQFCREFLLEQVEVNRRSIACRKNSGWQIVLSTEGQPLKLAEEYQTASGITPSLYEKQVYELVDGEPFSLSDERNFIENDWQD